MNLDTNQISVRDRRFSSYFERFRVFGGIIAPHQPRVMLPADRPKANVLTRVTVCVLTVAALLTLEVQAFSVGRRDMTTPGAATAGVLWINQFSLDTLCQCLVGNLELQVGIGPALNFRPQVFPFIERRIAYVAQVFQNDLPAVVRHGIGNQGFGCNMQEMFRYGSLMARHPFEKASSRSGAYGLNLCSCFSDAGAQVVKLAAVEEKGFGVARVSRNHHALQPYIDANYAARLFEFRNLNFVAEQEIPHFAISLDVGAFPTRLGDIWMVKSY